MEVGENYLKYCNCINVIKLFICIFKCLNFSISYFYKLKYEIVLEFLGKLDF